MADFTADEIGYLVNHLFLPPQLPQKDDFVSSYDNVLLRLIQQSLSKFIQDLDIEKDEAAQAVAVAISNFTLLQNEDGNVDGAKLAQAFHSLSNDKADTLTPIHIRAQNAAIIVNNHGNEIEIEAFELSPTDSAVMGASGRLRRCFPGPSVSIDKDQFSDTGLHSVLVKTLSNLSYQEFPGTAASDVPVTLRDTSDPGLVTELLFAFLQPMGRKGTGTRIWKHTRQDVLYDNSGSPWRRSSLWLLIRVVMQLVFTRHSANDSDLYSGRDYKLCMLHILATLLDQAVTLDERHSLAPDVLHCMSAKIVRRMLKLDARHEEPGIVYVQSVLRRNNMHLEHKWDLIQLRNQGDFDLLTLSRLNFINDVSIALPSLDEFLSSLTTRKPSQGVEYLPYNLERFETWVASHLYAWSARNETKPDTCASLGRAITQYHAAAKNSYSSNPETTSVMILTLLELWVQCDRTAIHEFPMLRDYDPEVPEHAFQYLLLRTKDNMLRLQKIEHYVTLRRIEAKFSATSFVFQGFGTTDSFSVRHFDKSAHLQVLHREIEFNADNNRSKKCEELEKAKVEYDRLMHLHDTGSCQTVSRETRVFRDGKSVRESSLVHKEPCVRCSYKKEAKAMQIDLFEWPLPSDSSQAKSVVFELHVPPAFSSWRNSTIFLLMEVLGKEYTAHETARNSYPLSSYDALHRHYQGNETQRFSLMSSTQPNAPSKVKVDTRTLISMVCVDNGLNFRYFDNWGRGFVRDLGPSDYVLESCTYKLPTQSSSLQRFILRRFDATDSTSNDVIETQSSCPGHIGLAEYRSLAATPVGCRLQWMNILVQLTCPTLDFKKIETILVLLQTIYQAGPRGSYSDSFRRAGHSVIGDEIFVQALLERTKAAAARIESNWESSYALNAFISIVLRVLSLAHSLELKVEALRLLIELRKIPLRWTKMLKEKCDEYSDSSQKSPFLKDLVSVTFECIRTFDVDQEHLETILQDPAQAAIFLRCSILIHEYRARDDSLDDHSLESIMYSRWQRLSCRLLPFLSASILSVESTTSLDDAIQDQWPEFERGSPWQSLTVSHWAISETGNHKGRRLPLHYNLLTGQLLVDGSPLSRLSSQYESHNTYRRLFDHNTFQVVPSCMPGMQFASKEPYLGHTLHFGLQESTLLIKATRDGHLTELIPEQVFRSTLPHMLVNNFVHWYNSDSDSVEFREKQNPWMSTTTTWTLTRDGGRWRLSRQGKILVDPKSPTGLQMATILEPLQSSLEMKIVTASDGQKLEIELPKFQLGFYLTQSACCIMSRDFKGFQIDTKQSFGTLIGLNNKLVLTNSTGDDRRVLIPPGKISFFREKDHVHVKIQPASGSIYIYKVGQTLGILRDNGELYSKLLLVYIHGLTSFCLPDPFTCHTGTEQSLSLLRGAAVRSFQHLTKNEVDLLHDIQALTPRRNFCPIQCKAAQTVGWNLQLPALSQHPSYYKNVSEILKQTKLIDKFCPDKLSKRPGLSSPDAKLLRRDAARTSAFRVSSFGSEMFFDGTDVKYQSRDLNLASERAIRALSICATLFNRNDSLRFQPFSHPELASHLLDKFKSTRAVSNACLDELSAGVLDYDGKYLVNHLSHWAELWCWLHRQSQNMAVSKIEPFQLMMWFATMSFDAHADTDMIRTAASMFLQAEMQDIQIPTAPRMRLKLGDAFNNKKLRGIIATHALGERGSPEPTPPAIAGESLQMRAGRVRRAKTINQKKAVDQLLAALEDQWPCPRPREPQGQSKTFIKKHLDLKEAMVAVTAEMKNWHRNLEFSTYLELIETAVAAHPALNLEVQVFTYGDPGYSLALHKAFITSRDFFSSLPPRSLPNRPRLPASSLRPTSKLHSLVHKLQGRAKSTFEQNYARELGESMRDLHNSRGANNSSVGLSGDLLRRRLDDHLRDSKRYAAQLLSEIRACIEQSSENQRLAMEFYHCPRLCAIFLLQHLSQKGWDSASAWQALPQAWQPWIIEFGIALTEIQRATRLTDVMNNEKDLMRELQNEGHTNWDPAQYPESLILEIENGILIRKVQEEIASLMRQPPDMENAVMQLNMGEGKSSVIVPIVVMALADRSKLVRVVVTKAQSRLMFHDLVAKLGGLVNRRVFTLPFSRALKLNQLDAQAIYDQCQDCIETGGVMFIQPEHILSLKLMGLEYLITNQEAVGRILLRTQSLLDAKSRDIVDESDENFSVKFELIFTMGSQVPIEFGPQRWIVIQEVLGFMRKHASIVQEILPKSIEVQQRGRYSGEFPRIRLLKADATEMLFSRIVSDICKTGFSGFPISRQTPSTRQNVIKYITQQVLRASDVKAVEQGPFWTGSTTNYLLLLRGLFAGGLLAFAFERKRWRVNYGLDSTRQSPTLLAVPYRAKDKPAPRSEFSHPDIVITLTCNSYYYGGLSDDQMSQAFEHLIRSDQPDAEYQAWVQDTNGLPASFRSLMGINLKDKLQCEQYIFPTFRFAKRTIDYFLQAIVFPKQMREFPQKLSASGWDLGDVKTHPTTGFSGTVGSSRLLPLDVKYLDIPSQLHTDALVLENLLQPENEVVLLPDRPLASSDDMDDVRTSGSDASGLLDLIVSRRDPNLRVIIDVGAQILELANVQVAKEWLILAHETDPEVQAAIYFDDDDEIMVLDIQGGAEQLRTSPFAEQLDVCVVFLDEAHTRGTDLRLPECYRAAVTLGANLTKDRLLQACMRMRKLGEGQSLVFCVPSDIQAKIRDAEAENQNGEQLDNEQPDRHIGVSEILQWAMGETCMDLWRNTSLWASQGRRFDKQKALWHEAGNGDTTLITRAHAAKFLEKESQSLEQRYRPTVGEAAEESEVPINARAQQIVQRCVEVGSLTFDEAALQEEQERELAPEMEEERQNERPPPAEAARHILHPDLRVFVLTGVVPEESPAFMPAFRALQKTTAAKHLDVDQFPKDILVTKDFATTLKKTTTTDFISDACQRPVNWILTSQPSSWDFVVIISPFEAQELLPTIKKGHKTTLHVYSARPNLEIDALDDLKLYTVPSTPSDRPLPTLPLRLAVQLNLFAGQLHFKSFEDYVELCNTLRISWGEATRGDTIDADGFIRKAQSPAGKLVIRDSALQKSPVNFLKTFLSKTRRDCQPIERTPLGQVLDGTILQRSDFETVSGGEDVHMSGFSEDEDVEMTG
ncbi:hypothetical protein N0V93_006465 [Gnomoniopsis smithogilvyi]|uniref:ubiquitinyl hydrolase 1 n=1 Tax=Gnomoniopsis smithogilvyi TaxID=1191159 RepID=A0A9W8YN90_9PEZI|nr:hypothetical protein N0V93_006465 [Gnomoniopsis smithogilvyi]